jgi:predicted transcriptional regulator of viral defense system
MEYKMKKSAKTQKIISSKLIRTLSAKDKNIFTIADVQKITRTSSAATRMLLSDLVSKKWLIRLAPGHYLIVPLSAGEKAEFTENWYVVAKHLIEPNPYYLSYYSALDIHEMTTQPLMTIYISTSRRRKQAKVLGATFRFVYTNPSKLWGIDEIWVKPAEKAKVSDLERTIIDCLDNPKLCGGISEVAKGLWKKREELDYAKLVRYVDRFGSKAVAKRLGFLLELYRLGDNVIPKLKNFVTPTFILLDPSLPAKGKYQSAWRLRINLHSEELKEIIKT